MICVSNNNNCSYSCTRVYIGGNWVESSFHFICEMREYINFFFIISRFILGLLSVISLINHHYCAPSVIFFFHIFMIVRVLQSCVCSFSIKSNRFELMGNSKGHFYIIIWVWLINTIINTFISISLKLKRNLTSITNSKL